MSEIIKIMEKSSKWLLQNQDGVTGGWGDRPGSPPNTLNTAETIIALLDGNVVTPGDERIKKAIQFLENHLVSTEEGRAFWPREVRVSDEEVQKLPDLVRTTFAIQALIKAGVSTRDNPVVYAVNWLMAIKNEDNGWGYCQGQSSKIMSTCFVLLALCECHRAGMDHCKSVIENALTAMIENYRQTDGSFGEVGRLQAVHTAYAVLVLQSTSRCKLNRYEKEAVNAIDWLIGHPDESMKLVEEIITIDPTGGKGNYNFLFLADFLLLKLLTKSDQEQHYNSKLARDALLRLKDKQDYSGGFYGYRVFSWSTTNAITALSAARFRHLSFPKRQQEKRGLNSEVIITVFAVLLALFGALLSLVDHFQVLQASFFVFLGLLVLLAYGKIQEKSFQEMVKSIWPPFKKGKN